MVLIWYFIFGFMLLGWLFATFYPTLAIKKSQNSLTKVDWVVFGFGYLLDVALQLTVLNLIFLDVAQEKTISERIARLANNDTGWRGDLAYWMYKKFIHPHDPGHMGVRIRG